MTDPQAEPGITPPKKPMPGGFSLEHFMEGTKPKDIEALAQAMERDEPDPSVQSAPLVPPMPKWGDYPEMMDAIHAMEAWGRQCAEIAQAQVERAVKWESAYRDAQMELRMRDGLVTERDALRARLAEMKLDVAEAQANAQAGAEAEQRIRGDERGKCRPFMSHNDECYYGFFGGIEGEPETCTCGLAAILGTGGEAVDLSKCPKCGGPADNGHDRCLPPNPYFCSKCSGDAR